jgi:ACS family hexuronate transporter-like MFS transporter
MANSAVQPMVDPRQVQAFRWVVLALVVLTWITTFFIRLTWPPLIPVVVPILHMKMTQAGAFMSAFYIGYVITQIPGGLMADRFGARMTLAVTLVIGGISTIAMGSINDFTTGFILRVICGLAFGGDYAAAARVIMEWFRPQERGIAFGAMFTGPMAGIVLSSLIVVPLNQAWGWRWAFRSSGIIAIIIALVIYFVLNIETAKSKEKAPGLFAGFPIVFSNRNVLLPAIAGFCTVWVQMGAATWVFAHIKKLGFAPHTVASVVLIYGIGGILSSIVSGWISDRIGNRKMMVIVVYILTVPATIIFGYQTTLVALIVWGFIFGFISYGPNPHLTIFMSEAVERKYVGLANGTGNLIYQFANVIVPLVTGWSIDVTGNFNAVWWMLAAGPFIAIFLTLPVDQKRRMS